MKTQLLALSVTIVLASMLTADQAFAQQPERGQRPTLFSGAADQAPTFSSRGSGSNASAGKMTTAELRQARALYRAQQRVARLEYNLWMGYEPLRPNWNAVPMMSSRYGNNRIYVPVYFHTR